MGHVIILSMEILVMVIMRWYNKLWKFMDFIVFIAEYFAQFIGRVSWCLSNYPRHTAPVSP
jgi:hypothetical protein